MKVLKNTLAILMVLSIVLVSCKKEDPKPDNFQPKFKEKNTLKISPALQNNTDTQAQTAYNSANALKQNIEAYSALFNIPEDAQWVSQKTAAIDATGSWTWTYGQYTVLFTLGETPTKYNFTYDYKYNSTSYYSITGWESKTQTEGHYEAGYIGFNSLIMDWNTTATGYFITMDYTAAGYSAIHYTANYNNDGSGDFSQTLVGNSYATYSAAWGSDGHGTATTYDGSTGSIINTYTF